MIRTFLAAYADSMESAVMRRLKQCSVRVQSLETKLLLSYSGAAHHLELSRPVHADLSKANDAVASEGMITGSADAFTLTTGIELIGGTAFIRPLGFLRVSNGTSGYMFVRNPEGAVTARVAVGFVDLDRPKGHQWVAELTFEAPQPGTSYGETNVLDYALQRWIPANQPGGAGSFGKVIRSGTATLRFPHGLPSSGEGAVPFKVVLRASD
jgi:hypothetical protein